MFGWLFGSDDDQPSHSDLVRVLKNSGCYYVYSEDNHLVHVDTASYELLLKVYSSLP